MRVSDIELWQAPLAFAGQDTAEVRAKLADAEVPYALLVDSERRPRGWLSQRDLAAPVVPSVADSPAEPIIDRDAVVRDALSDLLESESQYGPVVDAGGSIAGVLSIEIMSEFLHSPQAEQVQRPAPERIAD
jgi:osmoprotectant transport system ATP-binding protein